MMARLLGALCVAAIATVVMLTGPLGARVDRQGAQLTELTINSGAVGRRLPVSVVVPRGSGGPRRRPLLVFLHGRGGNQRSFLNGAMFAALARLGVRAPIVAFPYGGDHSYWHDRTDGAWGRYVMTEVIPRVVRRFKANGSRIAIGGVSMGGFGAYDLARLHPARFCAVGGHSPALWQSSAQTAPGAFDNSRDFARHDVIAAARASPARFTRQPVWLDAGRADPFRAGDHTFVAALRADHAGLIARTWPGGHNGAYWNSHWSSYLGFYADALARCKR